MPEYLYKAQNREGQVSEGTIDAGSEDQAITALQERGLVVLSLEEAEGGLFGKDISSIIKRVTSKELSVFTRQLATLVNAQVPILESLQTLSRQSENEYFSKVIVGVAAEVEGGASLSQAFNAFPKVFTDFYVRLIQSGELAGRLSDTLTQLADFLERRNTLIKKIRSALAYPIFVVIALVGVILVMFTTIIPQLLEVIEEAGVEDIPASTKVLIVITNIVNNYFAFIIGGIVLFLIFFIRYIRTEEGALWWDKLKIDIPQFGSISRAFYMARMSESLSTMVRVGVPILDSLSITSDLVGNRVYRQILLEAAENVRSGGMISETFAKYDEVPILVSSMLAVGEKSGKTDTMLENVAKFYKEEADNAVGAITSLIEPVIIVVLGVAIGFVVASILLPIFSLVNV